MAIEAALDANEISALWGDRTVPSGMYWANSANVASSAKNDAGRFGPLPDGSNLSATGGAALWRVGGTDRRRSARQCPRRRGNRSRWVVGAPVSSSTG